MRSSTRTRLTALWCAILLVAAACGDGNGDTVADDDGAPGTIRVPEDHDTIQAAVDAASPGDLVLIAPGVYHEDVDVTVEELTIRGLDRNEVILDGEFELETGITAFADGVAIENMTARNYTSTGFYWTGVSGYRGSYLTAYRNGTYGIYAFDSVDGQFDNSYGGGHADAGFYIGQCYPCNAVIDNVVSENNGLGYSGTNSGGELFIVNSTFRNNRAGIVPNTGSYQLCYPNRATTIVGNTVHDNNSTEAPAISVALLAQSNGILLAGAVRNQVERNWVADHERTGIGLVPFPEEDASDLPPPRSDWDRDCDDTREDEVPEIADEDCVAIEGLLEGCAAIWNPFENTVVDNAVEGSGVADLAVGTVDLTGTGETTDLLDNCFSGNEFSTSAPEQLEQLAPCEGDGTGDWDAGALDLIGLLAQPADAPPEDAWKTAPVPPEQPDMPDAADAPARPATDVPMSVDLGAITRPEGPSGS